MYCPNCGSDGQAGGHYCARCGTWLPEMKRKGRRKLDAAAPHEILRLTQVFSLLSAVLALVAGILLYATHLGGRSATWAALFAAAQLLVICVWQIVNFVLNRNLSRRMADKDDSLVPTIADEMYTTRRSLAASDATPMREPSTSVVERTTELLNERNMSRQHCAKMSINDV